VRHQILDAPLFLDAPGVDDARAERRKLLSQIDDYLLRGCASRLPGAWSRWSDRQAPESRPW
jgi:hypothetical protein